MTGPERSGAAGHDETDDGFARAAMLIEVDRPQQALDALARLPAALADDPRAFGLRADALLALERWAEAADAARRGLAAGGPDPRLLGSLGNALDALGDYPAAERTYLDALALDPSNPVLLCWYALLCILVEQRDKASRLLALAVDEAPDHPIVYLTRIELAHANGDDRTAERVSGEFLGRYPDNAAALALHGRSAAMRGRMVAAYRSLRQAVAADPTEPRFAEAAMEARVNAHPLLIPLRPLYRIGPLKGWLIAVVVILGLRALDQLPAAALVGGLWLLYSAYSWIAPSLVRRLVGTPAAAPAPVRARVRRWVVGAVVLVVALGCVGFTGMDLGPAVRAARGDGHRGTIVLTEKDCDRRGCDWSGDFTSDDGSVVFRGAAMQDGVPTGAKVGDELPALHTGARDGVYPVTGSDEWIYIALIFALGIVVVLGWIVMFPVMALLSRR